MQSESYPALKRRAISGCPFGTMKLCLRAPVRFRASSIPEGLLEIARHFNAGYESSIIKIKRIQCRQRIPVIIKQGRVAHHVGLAQFPSFARDANKDGVPI